MNKTLKPEQVTAIIDTREQTPIDLAPLKSVHCALATGDYSVLGMEHLIAVERKAKQDLVACVGRERERFEREIQRLRAYQYKALVIECPWSTFGLKQYKGDMHPNAIEGSLISWQVDGLPIYFAENHGDAGKFIARFLFAAARKRWNESHSFITAVSAAEEPAPPVEGTPVPA